MNKVICIFHVPAYVAIYIYQSIVIYIVLFGVASLINLMVSCGLPATLLFVLMLFTDILFVCLSVFVGFFYEYLRLIKC